MVNQNKNNIEALSIKNVSKTFDNKKVLDSIYLDIEKNQFVCFLGPSGCGKTTLLRIISGLEIADAGIIHMFGDVIDTLPISNRNLGIVFQSYALFPNLTVKKNIQYGMDGLDKDRCADLTAKLLSIIDMTDKQDSYPTELSGGQQQRVALARAIAVNPKILLLDEPLSALDKNTRNTLRLEIKRLHRQFGLTSIMVTHDQEEALMMADKIVVMNNSKIEQVGTPQEIYKTPKTKFVAEFIGNMSFLPISITGLKKFVAIHEEDCSVVSIADPIDGYVGVIVNIDFIGAGYRLHINIGDCCLMVLVNDIKGRGNEMIVGGKLKIILPKDKWHIYE